MSGKQILHQSANNIPDTMGLFCPGNYPNIKYNAKSQKEDSTVDNKTYSLVPNLNHIANCPFYWGKMDSFEAEILLDGQPEGTFLVRDSVQNDYLFSISWRTSNRTINMRFEKWYKTCSHCPCTCNDSLFKKDSPIRNFMPRPLSQFRLSMNDIRACVHNQNWIFPFPMKAIPLKRTNPFDLKHLARATICSRITHDSVNDLPLPNELKSYCKEYRYDSVPVPVLVPISQSPFAATSGVPNNRSPKRLSTAVSMDN